MEQLVVTGKTRLTGAINIHGAKNAALPILCATVLVSGCVTLHNVPAISDIGVTLDILRYLGAKVSVDGTRSGTLTIDASHITTDTVPVEMVNQMRASILFMGGLVARLGQVTIGYPGGCKIGARPIDLHLSGLRDIGVVIAEDDGERIVANGHHITGGRVDLLFPSVGATQNIILAAVLGRGTTTIHGAAIEPEIIDMINMLVGCGARIRVRGSSVIVEGVEKLHSGDHRIMGDRIVAGTYLAGVGMTEGYVSIRGVERAAMLPIIEPFQAMGMDIRLGHDELIAKATNLRAIHAMTEPHPGFPTDVGPQLLAAMCFAQGTSVLEETIFETRDKHVAELNKMGANITILETFEKRRQSTFIVNQIKTLYGGQTVHSKDLRGGATLVLAGLAAEGTTVVQGYEYIARGYEDLAGDLNSLGANIVKQQKSGNMAVS